MASQLCACCQVLLELNWDTPKDGTESLGPYVRIGSSFMGCYGDYF